MEKNFNFRPYTFTLRGVAEIELYADLGGNTIQSSNDEVPMNNLTWLATIFPTLRSFNIESKMGVISYNP